MPLIRRAKSSPRRPTIPAPPKTRHLLETMWTQCRLIVFFSYDGTVGGPWGSHTVKKGSGPGGSTSDRKTSPPDRPSSLDIPANFTSHDLLLPSLP